MLDTKVAIVLTYLKEYFKVNSKPIEVVNININGLTSNDILEAIDTLDNLGYLNRDNKYISSPIESINS